MSTSENINNVLRYKEDDADRMIKFFDEQGVLENEIPYSVEQNAAADIRQFVLAQNAAREQFLQELMAGLPGIIEAKNVALADAAAMDAIIADLIAKRDAVQAFPVPGTYAAATITAIKNDLVAIRNTLIGQAQYRKAVDLNAVTTDNALIWVAKVITDQVLD